MLEKNEETLKKYPYYFELKVKYHVKDNTLTVSYEVENKDSKNNAAQSVYEMHFKAVRFFFCFLKHFNRHTKMIIESPSAAIVRKSAGTDENGIFETPKVTNFTNFKRISGIKNSTFAIFAANNDGTNENTAAKRPLTIA